MQELARCIDHIGNLDQRECLSRIKSERNQLIEAPAYELFLPAVLLLEFGLRRHSGSVADAQDIWRRIQSTACSDPSCCTR